jgi:hypothetical protein
VSDGAARLAQQLSGEIQLLLARIEQAKSLIASLPKMSSPESEASARREYRQALAGARRQARTTGTLAAEFRARRAETRQDWWYEPDAPPPPPGRSPAEIYRQRQRH